MTDALVFSLRRRDPRVATGEHARAFERALAAHGAQWFSACLRITRSRAAAEDAVQEALAKAWSERLRFRGDAELSTWVHRIALNCAIDVVRRRMPAQLGLDALMPASNEGDAVFDRSLRSALTTLTELERVCFVLKHLESWTLEEIANELDHSINSVKQALFRAVQKLRGALAAGRL
jgi:RNA polymerase sigma-70 factor, ECF subfamily